MNSSSIGFRGERGPILIALMVTTGLAALDSTIIATAVPSIVSDLRDFAQFPWLFSIYLLAQAVTVPIYSKLSDVVGRKPILLIGIGLFLVGSIFCGAAWSMPVLILARAVQGLGAGAILPMSITVAGDIYTLEERAKVQGYIASVWAVSSVLGPTLGGLFSQYVSWRWIFFLNLPLGAVALTLLVKDFHERITRKEHRIDYLGATLLTVSLSLLILGVLEGGQAWAWSSPQSLGSFLVGGVLLAVFFFVERRAQEPVLPLWVFSRRLLLTTSLVSFGLGAALLGLTSYVPTYLVRVLGVTPLVAGAAVASLMIGWPIAASQSGRFYLRIGFRNTVLIGLALVVAGATLLALTAAAALLWVVVGCCFLVGLGFGLVGTPVVIAAQSSVPWHERGVATGTNMFFRAVGSSVGVAIFGAVANAVFAASPKGENNPAAVTAASDSVFWAVLIAALAMVLAAWAMPKTKPTETVAEPAPVGE